MAISSVNPARIALLAICLAVHSAFSEDLPRYYFPYSNGVAWRETIAPQTTTNSLEALDVRLHTEDGYKFDSPAVSLRNPINNSFSQMSLFDYLDSKYTNALNNIEYYSYNQYSVCVYNKSVLLASGPTNFFKQYCGDKYSSLNEPFSTTLLVTPFSLDHLICVNRSLTDFRHGNNFFVTDVVSKKNILSMRLWPGEGFPDEMYWIAPGMILTVMESRHVKYCDIIDIRHKKLYRDKYLTENPGSYLLYRNGLLILRNDGHGNIIYQTGESYCKSLIRSIGSH